EKPRPLQGGERISEMYLQSLRDRESLWQFRMTPSELLELARVLRLPSVIRTEGRHKFTAIEALGLTCARLRSSGDLYELVSKFDRSAAAISEIVTWVIIFIDEKWGHLLEFDHEHLLSPHNLEKYAEAVHKRGSPLTGVWGFIDCTIRRICRPSHWQRQAYNGHKKHHALKFQAVML
ncbi:hypothetical protein DEU56DRAFT_708823, partial [Suillus clintonianus]|uniref:uncharacterized protein n=1 Tax=Suillus clintonianus TaxID=1904413 RepID=UPI001B87EEC1